MAKIGFDAHEVPSILADLANKEGWVLCVGAGISRPLFPSWHELVARLIRRDSAVTDPGALVRMLLDQYTPDAIIQAAQDRLDADDEAFRQLLTMELYATVEAELPRDDYDVFCDILAADRPAQDVLRNWTDFLQIFRTRYPSCTALSLANVLSSIARTRCAPRAVLSFNAEPLLLALTNALEVEKFVGRGDPMPRAGDRRMIFDYITHSVSRRRSDRIPYVFCHGLLPVPDPRDRRDRHESADKLVFSEAEYLQLANSSFSWQSSIFLSAASTQHIAFVGVSLSDSNMRRWLAWAHKTRRTELERLYGSAEASTAHYWITKRPADEATSRWFESSLSHLGVRPVWMSDWSEVEATCSRMLSL